MSYLKYAKNEINAIIELEEGIYGAFEIKLSAYAIDNAAAKLIEIKNKIIKTMAYHQKY